MNHLELVVLETHVEHVDTSTDQNAGTRTHALIFARRRLHNGFALAVGDALAMTLALLGAILLRYWATGTNAVPAWGFYLLPACTIGALYMRLLPGWGLDAVEETRRIFMMLAILFGLTAILHFAGRDEAEMGNFTLGAAFLLSIILLPYVRSQVKNALGRGGEWGVPTVVYGAGPAGRQVIRQLHREPGLGYHPVAVLEDNPKSWGRTVEGVRVLGHTRNVTPRAPVAILAMPGAGNQRQMELLEGSLSRYRRVLVIPELFEAPSLWLRPRDLSGIVGLEITSDLTSRRAQFVKRISDILLVYVTLPVWLPLCGLLTALIWLTDGVHPLTSHVRTGRDGKEFRMWQFRTMVPKAEEVLQRKLEEDDDLRAEWETTYRLRRDPRTTFIGRLMRRYSVDVLPLIWNVLRGEMSLVGPRPLPAYHRNELPERVRDIRESVLPGVTGLWQFSGLSGIGIEGVEQWDPYYVRNWSIYLDLVVLARTLRRSLSTSEA